MLMLTHVLRNVLALIHLQPVRTRPTWVRLIWLARSYIAYADDPYFADDANTKGLNLLDGIWWQGDVIFVPDTADIKQQILKGFHDSPCAGHMGVTKTRSNIQR